MKKSRPARAKNVSEEEKVIVLLMDNVNSGNTVDIVESKDNDGVAYKA